MLELRPEARSAFEMLQGNTVPTIPSWLIHPMDHAHLERLAGYPEGSYRENPTEVYLAFQKAAGTCVIDQWIPDNPLSMGSRGYEGGKRGATTGAKVVELDGIVIDSPEAVVEHLERFDFPRLQQAVRDFDDESYGQQLIESEQEIQALFGTDILKAGYGRFTFPGFRYGQYGYAPYFMAYALYPEVMERDFSLQADLALRHNAASLAALAQTELPRFQRLDHDMADGRGTLVRAETLEDIWFPHFARALEPVLAADYQLIWHCDGNLSEMLPRLLEVGLVGFQGFQYEHNMDYPAICSLRTRDGEEPLIIGGVSVTTTLPHGTPQDVKDELRWLVEYGPRGRLLLAATSTIAPGVPWENLLTLVEGLKYYQEHGRS